jgi:ATP-dependent helicase HrpB
MDLPAEACVDQVRAALAAAGAAVLQAPPGAGKTTIVPLRLLDEPWLAGRRIVMLEPRRLATRAAATRMASLLGEPVGATVGYSTRDERRVGAGTRIEVVTEGILTRRLQHDPSLPGVGLVVFDEVHERNLQTDLALAFTLDVRAGLRRDLRLLAMSATLDTGGIAAVLGNEGVPAPVIVSDGRQHPVEIRWSPPALRPRRGDGGTAAVVAAVLAAVKADGGDVLVFLPGASDIRRAEARLSRAVPDGVDVLPLFGALPAAEQDLALAPSPPGRRRIVLATDIAETSLTVAGVKVVVDAGQVRSPRYDPSSGLTRLHTGPASRSSADQRAGRAGRESPGVAYRLWSEHEHAGRRRFPQAEILSVDLAGFALEVAVWGTTAGDLAFLEAPPQAALDEGRALLVTLGALDGAGRPTASGRRMADLPLHPRLARMVVGAVALGLGGVACALAALLEDRDILRGHPDDLSVDVAERVSLIADPSRRGGKVDRAALSSARRRAALLGRRAGVDPRPIDLASCGRVLALAYPDRIGQARGRGRFRLRTGAGAWMADSDPLANEAFVVAAQLDADQGDSRIRLAAALDPGDLEDAAGAPVTTVTTLAWDSERDDLRATVTRSLDALVLGTTERRAAAGPAAAGALLEQARISRLGALPWTEGARALQQRVAFLRRTFGDSWPDLSDRALLATIDEWLPPLLAAAVDRSGLDKLDLTRVLRTLIAHPRRAELDVLAPTSVAIGPHRKLRVDYGADPPTAAARIQEFFGTSHHPTVAGGQVPLVLHLLSPAGRPVQVTADLPGFWRGSYAAVRKEMAGRYPKHAWPTDPSAFKR